MGLLSSITSKKGEELKIEAVEISKIFPDPNQPRKTFDSLKELADTIIKHGLQNPIHVRKEDEKYIIITGERRWKACNEYTELKVIPCIVHSVEHDEKTIRILQLIENICRKDLTPLEEAKAYKALLEDNNIQQKDLALEVGVSETAISRTLRLNRLAQKIQEEIVNYPDIPKALLIEIASEKEESRQLELWEEIKAGKIEKREELRRERHGLKKKDLESMNSDEIWEMVKKAVRKDRDIIKKLINAAQLEKLIKEENES